MKIKIQGFCGTNHSWAKTNQNIARALIKQGYEVHLNSTNGYEHFPVDLTSLIKPQLDKNYDRAISYTAMKNFPHYLSDAKKKLGIWNYEFDVLPVGMAKYALTVDKFLPSSTFFYNICLKNKIPAEKMQIIPHGVDWDLFQNAKPLKLKTEKKYKLLINFGQPHIRKNISGTLEAFGKAFTSKDDVCLVIKGVNKKPTMQFEIDFQKTFNAFKNKFKNHGEVLIFTEYIQKIEELYKACDALFMLPHAEAFFFPALEMLASGGMVITSNYGGQLDFLNKDNSILIDGKMIQAPRAAQYWNSSVYASMFEPNTDLAAEQLQKCYQHDFNIIKKEKLSISELKEKFNWDIIANNIINL